MVDRTGPCRGNGEVDHTRTPETPGFEFVAADPRRTAASFDAHVTAFARALRHQDADFMRLANDRLEASRRFANELEHCTTWIQLNALQAAWAEARSQACLIEAQWLVLYADLVRHPDWLERQVVAAQQAYRPGFGR